MQFTQNIKHAVYSTRNTHRTVNLFHKQPNKLPYLTKKSGKPNRKFNLQSLFTVTGSRGQNVTRRKELRTLLQQKHGDYLPNCLNKEFRADKIRLLSYCTDT